MKSILLIGQSNMSGRGFQSEVPILFNANTKVLRNGRWQFANDPLHNDRIFSGVGLAPAFAAAWHIDEPAQEIGFIPCADGGTSLDDWAVGGALFDHALAQAKLAQRSSELVAILWHQGENDAMPEKAISYAKKFNQIVSEFRKELGVPTIPLIVGGLGDFLPTGTYGAYFAGYKEVNDALFAYAQQQENCYFVTAEGLVANEDQIHFNSISLRKFGTRYYQAFAKRTHVVDVPKEEESLLKQIHERPQTQQEAQLLLEFQYALGEIDATTLNDKVTALKS